MVTDKELATKKTCPRNLIGIAGVHFVVSELSRRGLIALPTVKNTAAYDVIVTSQNGRRHANLQVKCSQFKTAFFLAPPAKNIRTGPHDYYVFVRRLENEHRFEAFMLSGRETYNAVKRRQVGIFTKSEKQHWPSVHLDGENDSRSRRWRRSWLNFVL
jgi:hypothetical protein